MKQQVKKLLELSKISGENDSERIEKSIDMARAISNDGPVTILFEKNAVYNITKPINLDRLSKIEIDGNDSHIINSTFDSTHKKVYESTFRITNSNNMTIRNLTVDYRPLPFIQGVITSMNEATDHVFVLVDEGYEMPGDLLDRIVSGFFMVMSRETGSLKHGARNFVSPHKIIYVDKRTIEVSLDWKLNSGDSGQTEAFIGDVVLIRPHFEVAIYMENCDSTHFDCFNLQSSPGFGLIENGGEGGTRITNSSIAPGPKPIGATQNRLSSTNCDGTHFIGVVKGPSIINVNYSNTGDDPINIHNFYFFIVKKISSKKYYLSPKWDVGLKTGDQVKISEKNTFKVTGLSKIIFLEKKHIPELAGEIHELWEGKSPTTMPDCVYEIELEDEYDLAVGDALISVTHAASGAEIRNCSFHACGRVMVKCPNAIIENNTFGYTGFVAIHAGSDVGFWAESDFAENLIIRNNTFKSCGIGAINFFPDSDALGVIFVGVTLPLLKRGFANNYENKNILIEKNIFEDSYLAAIFASNCNGLRITGNVLGNCFARKSLFNAGFKYNIQLQSAIFVGHSKEGMVSGNIAKANKICKYPVIIDKSCDLGLQEKDNILISELMF